MTRPMAVVGAVLCIAAASCAHGPEGTVLAVDGRSGAHATLASVGNRVFAAWAATGSNGATDIYLAVSADAGGHFGAPVRVNDVAGDASAGGEQPPRVSATENEVAVVWVAKMKKDVQVIRAARSTDGGRTFDAARTITPPDAMGGRGWESAAISDDGVIHAAWLDGRNDPAAAHAAMQHATKDPHAPGHHMDMPAPRQDIFHAAWRGDGAPVETHVASNVCFCCKTAVVSRGHDVYIAWRHLYPGGVRDIALAHSDDDGQTFSGPVRVSADNWRIDACPDDGPAMAVDAAGAVHVVWPTLVKDPDRERIAIFYAVSRDGGRTFTPRARVDGARGTFPAHPRIALVADGSLAVVWDELTNGRRQIALRRMRTAGGPSDATAVEVLTRRRSAVYPSVAATENGLAVAWTDVDPDGSRVVVRQIPLR